MTDEKKQKLLEGQDAGTSPAPEAIPEEELVAQAEQEPAGTPALDNETVPTVEEQENAGIVNDIGDEDQHDTEIAPAEETEAETDCCPEAQDATEPGTIDPELGLAEGSATKTFTQSQVDEIAGKIRKETREKVTRSFLDRYGVNSEEELDDLFGDAQRYTTVQDMYNTDKKAWEEASAARDQELSSVKERVALLESGIDKNRYEDAKFILKGKGLEVTAENIAQELATHPEWKPDVAPITNAGLPFRKVEQQPAPAPQEAAKPATKLDVLGNSGDDIKQPELTDYEKAMRMFKV